MGKQRINFFSEDIPFKITRKKEIRDWIMDVIREEGKTPADLNFIFCSDSYLLNINREYLGHDTYTDIITFDNSDHADKISGDIFISIERVRENALKLEVEEGNELRRVVIHGVLHLIGYTDKTKADKVIMRGKEDYYILRK